MPAVDQERDGTRPGEFATDIEKLVVVLGDFTARLNGDMEHPAFGRMSLPEWGRWGYRHVDHHLRQFGL